MSAGEGPPEVLPSAADEEYECVLVDPQAAMAPPEAQEPPPGEPGAPHPVPPARPLCPPGYVPRRKRQAPYHLHGKERVTEDPPEQNPEPPPS